MRYHTVVRVKLGRKEAQSSVAELDNNMQIISKTTFSKMTISQTVGQHNSKAI